MNSRFPDPLDDLCSCRFVNPTHPLTIFASFSVCSLPFNIIVTNIPLSKFG